jgi:hypothetical protein
MENNNIHFNKFRFYNSNYRDIFFEMSLPIPGGIFSFDNNAYFQFKLEGFEDIDITLKCEWILKNDYSVNYLLIDFEQKNKDKYFTVEDVSKYKKYLEEFLYLLLDEYIFIEKVKFYKDNEEIKSEIFETSIPSDRAINIDCRYLFDLYNTKYFLQKYFYKYVEFRNKNNDSYGLFTIIDENLKILAKRPSIYEIIGMASFLHVFLIEELFDNEKQCIEDLNKLLISLEENNYDFINNFAIKTTEEEYRSFIKMIFIKARHEIHHSKDANYNTAYDYYKIIFILTKLYFLNKEIGIDITKEKIDFDIFNNIKHNNKADIIKGHITSYVFYYILKEYNINLVQMAHYSQSFLDKVFKNFVDNFNKNIDFSFFFKSEKEKRLNSSNKQDSVSFLDNIMFLEVAQYFEESGFIRIKISVKDLILKNEDFKNFILNIKNPLISKFDGIRDSNKKPIETINANIEDNYKDIIKLQKLVKCIRLFN